MDNSANPPKPDDERTLEQMPTAPTVPANSAAPEHPPTPPRPATVPTMSPTPTPPTDARTAAFQPRQLVGEDRFELVREIGRGGMGIVWLAYDKRLQEQTALKFLPPAIRSDPAALDDLKRETQSSRRLSHPHIVRIHDLFVFKGEDAFISMEFVEGHSLSDERIKRANKVLEWEELVPWVRQLCDALDYAHRQKVIHRDLKPANLLLDSQRHLKLTDFGIARVVTDSVSRAAADHGSSGTTVYMSPQQLEGKPSLPADDIYSLGATLYELLTSKPPFFTGDVKEQIRFTDPVSLVDRQRDLNVLNPVPTNVERTIMACLKKDRGARPRNFQEVAERLNLQKKTSRKGGKSLRPKPAEGPLVAGSAPAPPSTSGRQKPPSSRRSAVAPTPAEPPPAAPLWRRGLLWAAFLAFQIMLAAWLVHHYSSGKSKSESNAPAPATKAAAQTDLTAQSTAGTKPSNAIPKDVGRTNVTPLDPTSASGKKREMDYTDNRIISTPPTNVPQDRKSTDLATAIKASPPPPTKNVAVATAPRITNSAATQSTTIVPAAKPPPETKPPPRPPVPIAGQPWTNSLGMILVPVMDLPLFAIWETRLQDYRAFVSAAKLMKGAPEWKAAGFLQASNHPAVNIRWHDAVAFCQWLTERERGAGKLSDNQAYRLPRASEWNLAAGLLSPGVAPAAKPLRRVEAFLWGAQWPPPTNAGNFFGQEAGFSGISAFRDGFTNTAPVGSFPPNPHGIYDMAGNAWEWCEDVKSKSPAERVVKGGSWQTSARAELVVGTAQSEQSYRTNIQLPYVGFRCVLDLQAAPKK